ncbi:ATP-binding cassette domain-containing protein [Dactylosporangium sp. NPDC005572]|uniref:ABC transporter ATP-binding protein n=1 Tax=Dactylosporangium sp. NPDC005572 TaxID=3156889 RepID=UPI0033A81B0C
MSMTVTRLGSGYRSGVPVVEDISFEVGAGALGIIGRNGAGKSCLAQALSGALRTTAGTITVDGQDVTGLSSRRRVLAGISLVPEGRLVFGQLTVRENMLVAAHAAAKPVSRLADMEDLFPVLGHKRRHRAASLSGGEQQLLAIARALVQQPRVLILDEPSLGLSPVAVEKVARGLAEVVAQTSISLVLMEQNRELLTALCGEVLLLDQGHVRQSLDMTRPGDESALLRSYLGA